MFWYIVGGIYLGGIVSCVWEYGFRVRWIWVGILELMFIERVWFLLGDLILIYDFIVEMVIIMFIL